MNNKVARMGVDMNKNFKKKHLNDPIVQQSKYIVSSHINVNTFAQLCFEIFEACFLTMFVINKVYVMLAEIPLPRVYNLPLFRYTDTVTDINIDTTGGHKIEYYLH